MSQQTGVEQYDEDFLREMYRLLRLCREFERARGRLVDQAAVPGMAHLAEGQEGVAVGSILPLRDDDVIGSTHRPYQHVLAKGIDPKIAMAEFGGKVTGVCGGRGGEMHVFDAELGIETSGFIGGSQPHVAGAATAFSIDEEDRVGVAYFGDGGSNQGVILESMNLASVWNLPMIFICENNKYAAATPRDRVVAGEQISDRAHGFDMPGKTIDGQNVFTVYEEMSAAVDAARNGEGPTFIECDTYRFSDHYSKEDAMLVGDRTYRSQDEIDEMRATRDPIKDFVQRVVEQAGILSEDDIAEIDEGVEKTLDDAIEFMQDSEMAGADRAFENVYADQDYQSIPDRGYD